MHCTVPGTSNSVLGADVGPGSIQPERRADGITCENPYHVDLKRFNSSTCPREEDVKHEAALPVLLECSGTMFYLCFIFMETSFFTVKGACDTPLPDSSVPSLPFLFFLVFCQKLHQANLEQKVARNWPVCPPCRAPSQKEGAPHRAPGI